MIDGQVSQLAPGLANQRASSCVLSPVTLPRRTASAVARRRTATPRRGRAGRRQSERSRSTQRLWRARQGRAQGSAESGLWRAEYRSVPMVGSRGLIIVAVAQLRDLRAWSLARLADDELHELKAAAAQAAQLSSRSRSGSTSWLDVEILRRFLPRFCRPQPGKPRTSGAPRRRVSGPEPPGCLCPAIPHRPGSAPFTLTVSDAGPASYSQPLKLER